MNDQQSIARSEFRKDGAALREAALELYKGSESDPCFELFKSCLKMILLSCAEFSLQPSVSGDDLILVIQEIVTGEEKAE